MLKLSVPFLTTAPALVEVEEGGVVASEVGAEVAEAAEVLAGSVGISTEGTVRMAGSAVGSTSV